MIVFEPLDEQIGTAGANVWLRFDSLERGGEPYPSELLADANAKAWVRPSGGGPTVISDHRVSLDADRRRAVVHLNATQSAKMPAGGPIPQAWEVELRITEAGGDIIILGPQRFFVRDAFTND